MKTAFTRESVASAAESYYDISQGAIIHIQDPIPRNLPRIEQWLLPPKDVIIQNSGDEIVR